MVDDNDAGVVDSGNHLIVVVLDGGVEKPWCVVDNTRKHAIVINLPINNLGVI